MKHWSIALVLALGIGVLAACQSQAGSGPYKTGWVVFGNLSGSVPAGCAKDFRVVGSAIGVSQVQGKSVFAVFLSDQPVDSDSEAYTFALSTTKVSSLFAGMILALEPNQPGVSATEYNCNLTNPLSAWVVRDGQLTIDSIWGNQVSYHLSANMVPGTLNTSKATLSLYFEGTSPLAQ